MCLPLVILVIELPRWLNFHCVCVLFPLLYMSGLRLMILRQTLFAFLGQKRSKWVKLGQRSKIGEWLVLHPDFCWIDLCTELFVERGWGPRNGGGLAATKVIAISEWSHGGSPVQGAQLHNAKAQASKRPRGAMVRSVPLYGWGWIRMDWAHDIYICI